MTIYNRKWKDGGTMTTIALPKRIKSSAMALALLLDKEDPELLDFLESRFIAVPSKP